MGGDDGDADAQVEGGQARRLLRAADSCDCDACPRDEATTAFLDAEWGGVGGGGGGG